MKTVEFGTGVSVHDDFTPGNLRARATFNAICKTMQINPQDADDPLYTLVTVYVDNWELAPPEGSAGWYKWDIYDQLVEKFR